MHYFPNIRSLLPTQNADANILQVLRGAIPYINVYFNSNILVYEIHTIIIKSLRLFSFEQEHVTELLNSSVSSTERFKYLCNLVESKRIL